MCSESILRPASSIMQELSLRHRGDQIGVEDSCRNLLLNNTTMPFSNGAPGALQIVSPRTDAQKLANAPPGPFALGNTAVAGNRLLTSSNIYTTSLAL